MISNGWICIDFNPQPLPRHFSHFLWELVGPKLHPEFSCNRAEQEENPTLLFPAFPGRNCLFVGLITQSYRHVSKAMIWFTAADFASSWKVRAWLTGCLCKPGSNQSIIFCCEEICWKSLKQALGSHHALWVVALPVLFFSSFPHLKTPCFELMTLITLPRPGSWRLN